MNARILSYLDLSDKKKINSGEIANTLQLDERQVKDTLLDLTKTHAIGEFEYLTGWLYRPEELFLNSREELKQKAIISLILMIGGLLLHLFSIGIVLAVVSYVLLFYGAFRLIIVSYLWFWSSEGTARVVGAAFVLSFMSF